MDRYLHIIFMQVIDVKKSSITYLDPYGESDAQIKRLTGYWK